MRLRLDSQGHARLVESTVKGIAEQYGLEAMAHFTCVGATERELRATLDEMASSQIENVLALRGDRAHPHDVPSVRRRRACAGIRND